MQLTLLGTGDAAQVPVYNCDCAACERARQHTAHRRGPCSALLEFDGARWLIDSGLPDLADRFPPGTLTGVLQTHYHADHAQGLLHLRWGTNLRIPVLGPADPDGLADLYKHPGILDFSHTLTAFRKEELEGGVRMCISSPSPGRAEEAESSRPSRCTVTPVPLIHSRPTFGYVFEGGGRRCAYLTDTVGLPGDTAAYLHALPLDVLVLDCSLPPAVAAPRNHNDLTRALETAALLSPRRTVLTHIGHRMDAWLMENGHTLPSGVEAGYDGMALYST